MKRRTTPVVSFTLVATASVLGVSACGTYLPATQEQKDAVVAELIKRGFEDPTFVTDQYDQEMRFDAKVGDCRVFIARKDNGTFNFKDEQWNAEQVQKVRDISGGSMSSIVNASFIETYGEQLGWAHCLKK